MIKVVHISTSTGGGAGIAAFRFHEALLKSNNYQSVFVCAEKHILDLQGVEIIKPYIEIKKGLLSKLKKKFFESNFSEYKFRNRLNQIKGDYEIVSWPLSNYRIEENETVRAADIVHLHWVSNFLNYPTFFKKLANKKIVWTYHDMNPFMGIFHYQEDKIRNPLLSKLDKKALSIKINSLKKVDINVIILSKWLQDSAVKTTTSNKVYYHHISNGINTDDFYPLSLGSKKPEIKTILVISAYLNNYRKGIDLFINALKFINYPIKIISVGRGDIELPKEIELINFGPVDNPVKLNEIFNMADLFILPSREDNLPNVMLEAFSTGTPVLSFHNGGMKEYINDKNGLICEEINPQALGRSINLILSRIGSFDKREIRQFALNNFDIKKQSNKLQNLYTELLK